MAIFADNFNRANGPIGNGWETDPAGSITIAGNKASTGAWDSKAFRSIGRTDGYRVQAVASAKEWPILFFRYVGGWAGWYGVVWSGTDLELQRKVNGTVEWLGWLPSPAGPNVLLWAEVREIAGGTEIRWGHGATASTYVDSFASRPAGQAVGIQLNPGRTFDDFAVTDLVPATTTTTTTAPPTTTTTTTTVPPLPTDVTPGATLGHLSHHARLHAVAGITPTTPGEGDIDHLHHHEQLKAWYDPHHDVPLPAVTDARSHEQAHEVLHAWVNEPPTTTTTASTTTSTTTIGGGSGMIEAGAKSLLHPVYLNSGSVMQRDVSNMPIASNSQQIANYVRQQQVNTTYYTSMSTYQYNFPSYAVAASQVPPVNVRWKNNRAWDWTPQDVMDAAFGPRPIPAYAVPAAGTDAALVVYDIESDTMYEYWQAEWIGGELWAEWGSTTWGADNNYANQSNVGSLSASGLNGVLGQIGIGEVRAGWINHALIYAIPAPKQGVSWPAKQSDGWSTDPNAPMETQWARLPASYDVAQLDNDLVKMVARAAQTFGIALVDQAGAVAFCAESGAHEQSVTGVNPWDQILATTGGGEADWSVLRNFPWEQTQWAPIDWGRP